MIDRNANNPDRELVTQCVEIAGHFGANNGAFKVDPDENNQFAEKVTDRHWKVARRLMAQVSAQKAKTSLGVLAQARLIPMLLDEDEGSSVNEDTIAFIRSFVDSVRSFIETQNTASQKAP